jgi:tetratricopeptide (TPR) repeat protein
MPAGPGYPKAPGERGQAADALQQAAFALDSRRPQDAERIAADLLRRSPQNVQALLVFGRALLMQGRAQDAVAPLESAARGQHDPEINTQLAIALRQVGRDEDALAQLKRATKRRPPYAPAFQELGFLLAAMERYDEAIEALNRALELAPLVPQLSIQLGYVLLNRKDAAGAKAAFARALGIVPDSLDALFGTAKSLQGLGEYQAAADYYRRCLIATPDDESTLLNLGHCLLEAGQIEAGYECFRTAARGDAKRAGHALASLATSSRGRFWLKPSRALQFLRGDKR